MTNSWPWADASSKATTTAILPGHSGTTTTTMAYGKLSASVALLLPPLPLMTRPLLTATLLVTALLAKPLLTQALSQHQKAETQPTYNSGEVQGLYTSIPGKRRVLHLRQVEPRAPGCAY